MTFKSGLTAVLNHQNFEWNHSDFNRLFQSTETAVDFVTVFQEVARFDSERGYFVPKPQSAIQTTRPAYNEENKDDDENEEEMNPPPHKRANLDNSNVEPPAKATSHQVHSNPLDDSVLSKRMGKCTCSQGSLACSA